MQKWCCHIQNEYCGERRTVAAQPIEPDGISLQKANTKRPHNQQLVLGGLGGGDSKGPTKITSEYSYTTNTILQFLAKASMLVTQLAYCLEKHYRKIKHNNNNPK